MTEPAPIGWRAIVYDAPVLGASGARLGSVREVLGSDAEDVFHGVRVNRDGRTSHDVIVSADHVTALTRAAVSTDLTLDELEGLPAYDDEATYHLASVGWLRKHIGWVRDSRSDEEPG
jgi:hypothetical protein